MYLEFYNFIKAPFGADADAELVYPGAQYRYSLATLTHGVKQGMGMMVLTGESGCGKTVLFRSLQRSLEEEEQALLIIDDHNADISDVVASIASLLDRAREGMGLNDLVDRIRGRLVELGEDGRKLVVLVENAESLSDDVLMGLGVLSGIGTPQHKALQVVLFGSEYLKSRLDVAPLNSLQDRIRLHLELKRLSEAETAAYIDFRISAAGGPDNFFSPDAVSVLFESSQGNPREIIKLCDKALVAGCRQGNSIIDAEIVRESMQAELPELESRQQQVVQSPLEISPDLSALDEPLENVRVKAGSREVRTEPGYEQDFQRSVSRGARSNRRSGLDARFGVMVAIVVGGVFLGVAGYLISDLTTNGLTAGVTIPKGGEAQKVPSPQVIQVADSPVGNAEKEERHTSGSVIYQLLAGDDSSDRTESDRRNTDLKAVEVDSAIPVLAATEGVKPKVRPLEVETGAVPDDSLPVESEVDIAPVQVVGAERNDVSPVKNEVDIVPVQIMDVMPFPFASEVKGEWKTLPDKLSLSLLVRRKFGSWNDSIKDIIRETNPQLKSFDAIAAGTKIWVPEISLQNLVVHADGVGYYFYFRSTTGPITARKNKSYLQKKGFDAEVRVIESPERTLYRIYAGPFETSEQAGKAMESVRFTFAPSVLN